MNSSDTTQSISDDAKKNRKFGTSTQICEQDPCVNDAVAIGPLLAGVILAFSVVLGRLPWEVLLIGFFWSLGDNITINWKKILRKNNQNKS
jgi:hypothetical protein